MHVQLPTTHTATPESCMMVLLLLVHAITTPSHHACYVHATLLILTLALGNKTFFSNHPLYAHLLHYHGFSTHSQVQPISQPLL